MTTFASDTSVGGSGAEYTSGNDPTTGLGNDGHRTRFLAACDEVLAMAVWVKNKALEVLALGTAVDGILATHNLKHKALGNVSGAVALNLAESNYFSCTVTGNTTFSFTNVPSATYAVQAVLRITNGHLYTMTWPAGTNWTAGAAPASAALNNRALLTWVTDDGGTTFDATLSMGNL